MARGGARTGSGRKKGGQNAKTRAKRAAAKRALHRLEIKEEAVIDELAKLGFANMLDYISIGDDGLPFTDFSRLTRDQAAAIAEVTVETRMERDGDTEIPVRKVRFKLADKRGPLTDIGRHLGMFKDRVEHTGKNGGPIATMDLSALSDEQLANLEAIVTAVSGAGGDESTAQRGAPSSRK